MFFPLARGFTVPAALQSSDGGELTTPDADTLSTADCTGAPVATPEPVYVPATADSEAGWS